MCLPFGALFHQKLVYRSGFFFYQKQMSSNLKIGYGQILVKSTQLDKIGWFFFLLKMVYWVGNSVKIWYTICRESKIFEDRQVHPRTILGRVTSSGVSLFSSTVLSGHREEHGQDLYCCCLMNPTILEFCQMVNFRLSALNGLISPLRYIYNFINYAIYYVFHFQKARLKKKCFLFSTQAHWGVYVYGTLVCIPTVFSSWRLGVCVSVGALRGKSWRES